MQFTVLQKGYFWEGVGLLLFFGFPALISVLFDCDPLDCSDKLGFLLVWPIVSWFVGPGLYLVGTAHISISAASLLHKLLAIFLPLLVIVALVYAFNGNQPLQPGPDKWAPESGSHHPGRHLPC